MNEFSVVNQQVITAYIKAKSVQMDAEVWVCLTALD